MFIKNFFAIFLILIFVSCQTKRQKSTAKNFTQNNYDYYTEDDFNSFGKSLENNKIDENELVSLFRSHVDSSVYGDTIIFRTPVNFLKEELDTCWGGIDYAKESKTVFGYGISCQ